MDNKRRGQTAEEDVSLCELRLLGTLLLKVLFLRGAQAERDELAAPQETL
jgi:hypothetical protein